MIGDMPKKLPHLHREKTRHGKVVWYVRIVHGPRIRLKEQPGTKRFLTEYREALEKGAPEKKQATERKRVSLGWLIREFMMSGEWIALANETRKQFSYQIQRIDHSSGDKPYKSVTKAHIIEGRDRRRSKPTDANKFIKAMRKLYSFAISRGLCERNPTDGVALVPLPNKKVGFHTWTEDEVVAFENRWPIGTRQRLAFDILLYTGLRRGDAVLLGRQHIKDGIATIRTEKTGEIVTITILPPVIRSMAATKTGDLTIIVTARGKPFKKESFGTWYKKACVAAGVPGSAHGLRKAGAVRAAEAGATEAQLNALFGWKEGSRESATYTRKARRAKLAKESAKLLMMHDTPAPLDKVRDAGEK